MRVMVTGGGTGGHISPAVAIIEELQKRDPQLDLVWVGRKGGLEESVCGSKAIPFRAVSVAPWPRKGVFRRMWTAGKLARGLLRSVLLLRKFRPQVVLGVGGYVSLPLMWTAQRRGVPTVLHEQNRLLGMANRVLAPRAQRVFLSYADTVGEYPKERARVVGNPIRARFSDPPTPEAARAAFNLDGALPVVLVSGGSQGARTLNTAVAASLPAFAGDELQIIWMTGKDYAREARRAADAAPVRTSVYSFIDDMAGACAAADIVVSRAGASSTAELAQLGKPAVLVPYPYAAEGHQEQNARAFEEAGAAVVVKDDDFTAERFVGLVRELLSDPERLAAMGRAARTFARPSAAEAIVEEILQLVFEPVAED